jgi:hypothetical protein
MGAWTLGFDLFGWASYAGLILGLIVAGGMIWLLIRAAAKDQE